MNHEGGTLRHRPYGMSMAERLLRSGYHVVVYNRTRKKAEPLKNLGAEIAETAGKAVYQGWVDTDYSSVYNIINPRKRGYRSIEKQNERFA
jgi:hypothetical protein